MVSFWPDSIWTPEFTDPATASIAPCFIQVCLTAADEDALTEMLRAPLVKAFLLQVTAETLHGFGFEHPMGESWRGFQDIDPAVL